MSEHAERLRVGTGEAARDIAVKIEDGAGPAVFWLGGFRSDMGGNKAEALAAWARERGRRLVRFDYSGHGGSGGSHVKGTIGLWLEEAEAVFAAFAGGPAIIVGSSMGGWLALLMAQRRLEKVERLAAAAPAGRKRGKAAPVLVAVPAGPDDPGPEIRGLVLIAPATDFTEFILPTAMTAEEAATYAATGRALRPTSYGPPLLITRELIEDGRRHLMLNGEIRPGAPVHILHGCRDADIPWQHGVKLTERIGRDDVVLTLIKDGDHRLSRPEDLARLIKAVEGIAG